MLNSQIIARMNEPRTWEFEEIIDPAESNGYERFLKRMRMTDEEREEHFLTEEIKHYIEQKESLRSDPCNYWAVYSICKTISHIAELSETNFKELPLVEKLIQFTTLIKFVDEDTVFKGVREFHESEWCKAVSF